VRFNRGGTLLFPYGYVKALGCDPQGVKEYKMTGPENTSPEGLLRAAMIGCEAELRYVRPVTACSSNAAAFE
jgi:hypothetical protein